MGAAPSDGCHGNAPYDGVVRAAESPQPRPGGAPASAVAKGRLDRDHDGAVPGRWDPSTARTRAGARWLRRPRASTASLPFTGLDLGLLAAIGMLLALAGGHGCAARSPDPLRHDDREGGRRGRPLASAGLARERLARCLLAQLLDPSLAGPRRGRAAARGARGRAAAPSSTSWSSASQRPFLPVMPVTRPSSSTTRLSGE